MKYISKLKENSYEITNIFLDLLIFFYCTYNTK